MAGENGAPPAKRSRDETREGILLGYGNPLLDICVNGTEEFLNKYDLKADNAILAEDKHKPMFADMVKTFQQVDYIPGGATQNAIRVAQWLLGLPKATSFFGCISNDDFGKTLTEKAQEAGVNVKYQYTDKEPTGTCAVIVTGTHRSLCAYLAAANCFTEDHLDVPENWALVEKAQFYYVAGFPLTVCPPAIQKIAAHSHAQGKTFTMNLSAPFLCQFFKEPMINAMPFVDILFGNETEAVTFSEVHEFGTKDVEEIAVKLAELPKKNKERSRIVVITQGAEPALVVKDGKLSKYPVIPIDAQAIVDTNGAGDAFVGGFLAQLVLGKDIAECVRCGHYAANVIIQQSGCTLPEKPEFK